MKTSRVPNEWEGDTWVMGNQESFKGYAASDALPRWLRVTYAAYGHVRANGHAVFHRGELSVLLGEYVNGVHTPAPRQRVREAIDVAIDRGLLLDGSKALCLIVPRAAIAYGAGQNLPCKRHPQSGRNGQGVSFGVETTGLDRSFQGQMNGQSVSFQRGPSPLSSTSPRVTQRTGS